MKEIEDSRQSLERLAQKDGQNDFLRQTLAIAAATQARAFAYLSQSTSAVSPEHNERLRRAETCLAEAEALYRSVKALNFEVNLRNQG